MFKVDNNPILADDVQVLMLLKKQLAELGKNLFNEFKVGERNIQTNCPIHSEGQERRPSCGISTIDSERVKSGTVHCFTCGYTATLEEMISHCFGYNDFGSFGKKWLLRNFVTVKITKRPDLDLDFKRKNVFEELKKELKTIDYETELEKYRFYHPYMYQRKLTDSVIEMFDVGFDKNFSLGGRQIPSLTFPVKDKDGNILFIARRSIKGKIFNYPKDVEKPIYGLFEKPINTKSLIVCESIIDALTCYVYKKPAVALLGLGTKQQYEELKRLNIRHYILAFDSDLAGKKADMNFRKNVTNKLITSYILPNNTDINDLDKKEFDKLVERF